MRQAHAVEFAQHRNRRAVAADADPELADRGVDVVFVQPGSDPAAPSRFNRARNAGSRSLARPASPPCAKGNVRFPPTC